MSSIRATEIAPMRSLSSMTAIPCRKKKGNGCAKGWCVTRGSLLQDCLPVKFTVPKCKNEVFVRIDMKH